jgi:hypothetical protein
MFDSIDDTVTFAQASAGVLCYVLPLLQLLQTKYASMFSAQL